MKDTFPAYLGTRFFAIALATLGVLGLTVGDFAMVWQDVPKWVPERTVLAYVCAAFELLAGIGLCLWPASRRIAPWVQVYMVAWLVLLRLPQVVAAPLQEVSWLGFGETSILLAGALAIGSGSAGGEPPGAWAGWARRAAPFVFGLAVIPCGLAHYVYTDPTVKIIPAFIPAPKFWALFTGAAYILAGFAIVLRVLDRLAATLTAVMIACITFGVWLPALLAQPHDRLPWTALIISILLCASAGVIAESLASKAWTALPGSKSP